MLRRMRYVMFEEVESWLQAAVVKILDEIEASDGKVGIGIFPVEKPSIHKFNKDKERKPTNDSAGRIAHSLKNLERSLGKNVQLTPRLESMREMRVRHLIYVNDFVGTGDRFLDFWKKMVPGSVKAWCSRGWCKVWLVSFAAHSTGNSRIRHRIRAIDEKRIRNLILIGSSPLVATLGMRAVIEKYGQRLGSPAAGYGDLASPIVFQYGCPNNAPLIFWMKPSRSRGVNWKPLFPNRFVSNSLYPLFGSDLAKDALPEELWQVGHYNLALQAIDHATDFERSHRITLILALVDKNISTTNIQRTLILSVEEFEGEMSKLIEVGLIGVDGKITRFGKDVLARLQRVKKREKNVNEEKNFYPSSFLGFQREA